MFEVEIYKRNFARQNKTASKWDPGELRSNKTTGKLS
jgi:hypothetical protein